MTSIYNSPINFNIPKIAFRSNSTAYAPQINPQNDRFTSNPLYENNGIKAEIENTVKSNQRIMELLRENNLPIKVNEKELEKLQHGHMKDTRVAAAKIYSSLPQEMKEQVNLKSLQEAAMMHDFGKVLIPDAILNKQGGLTDKEWQIMQMHSELGYELLKNKGLDEHTLELIKYHHQTPTGNGYPAVNSGYEYGIDSQILNVADKYSALTENRSYKPAMSRDEALEIIAHDVEKGLISKEVFDAVKKAV